MALYPRDVGGDTLTIRHGKGDKARVAHLDALGSELLGRWMDRRAALGVNGHHPVFCAIASGKEGKALKSIYVRRLLYRLCERAGVDDGDEWFSDGRRKHRVHPHALRHSHALGLVHEGHPLIDIRDQLGHKHASTTDSYLQRISPTERLERMRAIRSTPTVTLRPYSAT